VRYKYQREPVALQLRKDSENGVARVGVQRPSGFIGQSIAKTFRIATRRGAIPSTLRELLVPNESQEPSRTRRTKSIAASELWMTQVVFP
jgi:hypothetical protein